MMRGFRNILWLLPMTLVLLWPLWSGPAARWLAPQSHGPGAPGPGPEAQEPRDGKSFTLEEVLFFQHKNGVRDWQIQLARLRSAEDNEELLHLEEVEAQFFAGEQRRFLITGQKGEYDSIGKLLTLEEDVQVHSEDDNFLMRAETLSYDDLSRRISTARPVRITGENMDIHGMGLVYDMEKGSYEVAGRVRVETW